MIKLILFIFLNLSCNDLKIIKNLTEDLKSPEKVKPNFEVRLIGSKIISTEIQLKLSKNLPNPTYYYQPDSFFLIPVKKVDSPTYREEEVEILFEGNIKTDNIYKFNLKNGKYFGYLKSPNWFISSITNLNRIPLIKDGNLDFQIMFGYRYPDFENLTYYYNRSTIILINNITNCEGFQKGYKENTKDYFLSPSKNDFFYCPSIVIDDNLKTIIEINIVKTQNFPNYIWRRWLPGIIFLTPLLFGSMPELIELEIDLKYEKLD